MPTARQIVALMATGSILWVLVMWSYISSRNIGGDLNIYAPRDPNTPKKYMMFVPAFGPNNQYRGLKEMMVVAQTLGRVLARPTFVAHHVKGVDGIRPFEKTFKVSEVNKFVETVSIEEFGKMCNGYIDDMIWIRDHGAWWKGELNNYMQITNLTVKDNHYPKHTTWNKGAMDDSIYWSEPDRLNEYLNIFGVNEKKCIGFAFPFRTVDGGTLGRHSSLMGKAAIRIEHSQEIQDVAKEALSEMKTIGEGLLTMHWRHGEQTCRVEPWTLHEGYDFCWGTAAYFWANLTEVIISLQKFMDKHKLTHIYLATDSPSVEIFDRMKKELNIFRARDVPILQNVTDNYYLSLIEQQICIQSKLFVGSWQSTWTEFIYNYWEVIGKSLKEHFVSIDQLLTENNYKYITHSYWEHILKKPSIPRVLNVPDDPCFHDNLDILGGDFETNFQETPAKCQQKCNEITKCLCWTLVSVPNWVETKIPICILKNKCDNTKIQDKNYYGGVVSGYTNCTVKAESTT